MSRAAVRFFRRPSSSAPPPSSSSPWSKLPLPIGAKVLHPRPAPSSPTWSFVRTICSPLPGTADLHTRPGGISTAALRAPPSTTPTCSSWSPFGIPRRRSFCSIAPGQDTSREITPDSSAQMEHDSGADEDISAQMEHDHDPDEEGGSQSTSQQITQIPDSAHQVTSHEISAQTEPDHGTDKEGGAQGKSKFHRKQHWRMSSSPYKDPVAYTDREFPFFIIPRYVELIGEADSMPPMVMLRERGKLMGHSLLQDLDNLHESGYCLCDPLSADSVAVDSTGRMHISEGTLIMKVRDEVDKFDRDWVGASDFLKELLNQSLKTRGIHLSLPPDVLHALGILKTPRIPKGLLAVFHPCWMPLHSRGQAIIDVNDYLLSAISQTKAEEIRNGLSHQAEWPCILEHNWFLQQWFEGFRNEDGTFRAVEDGKSFLLQQRILRCHCFDYRRGTHYTKDEFELLLHAKTPMLLPHLYYRLWKKSVDLYESLPIQRYFSCTDRDMVFSPVI
ncbi:hypothetical protein ACP4OV_022585 [Aristida adscensionis]